MKSLFSSLILALLLLSGCNSQPTLVENFNQKPSWVLNPNQNGKNGAIGIAGISHDQKISTQRKLAITRALDELSLQNGVKVQLSINKKEVVTNDRANTNMNSQSSYVASSSITAHIEQVWNDKLTNELYIWMVLD